MSGPDGEATHGEAGRLEHIVVGPAEGLQRLRAALPAGIEATPVPGGLVLREPVPAERDLDAAVARIEVLARAEGLRYDGHGRDLDGAAAGEDDGLDLQPRTFAERTGIVAGRAFALPLPDGRFGHAVHLGGDRRGHLLLDVRALVAERPAEPEVLRDAPGRYRQPILVWHTDFAALPLASAAPLGELPCEAAFRVGAAWPAPDEIAHLERRFGIAGTDAPEAWNALLLAMAEAGERLPGIDEHGLVTARVGRTGSLTLHEDLAPRRLEHGAGAPMPWPPARIDEVLTALGGGPDLIAARDEVE